MIHFDHVTKKYKDKTALDNISFSIERGEFVFFTGPSGAGKSTIIKLLLHDFAPTKGDIIVDHEDINQYSHNQIALYRRKLGIVFQDYKLLPYMDSYDNVAFATEVVKRDADMDDDVINALAVVDMKDKHKLLSRPNELSGGEQQRVAIARAIVNKPKIIIADEPTGNLDVNNSRNIMRLFEKINKRYGTTILMATHDTDLIRQFPHRTLTLQDGKFLSDFVPEKEMVF